MARCTAAGLAALSLGCMVAAGPMLAQAAPVQITGDRKVDALLERMTLTEKLALIRGTPESPATDQGEAGYLAGVPRLGIPPLRMADGPPGVLTRLPSQAETCTMGVAATFSTADAEQNGVVIAREAHALGIDVALQPFINLDRDLTFSRAYNTFGEDPVLTGAVGASEIRGIQSQGIMAMAKHYVGYGSSGYDVTIPAQALHEVYVAPFADAVAAGVASIMCSYNKINGAYACGNRATLTTILRDELHFRGFVTSDWGAVHSPTFINDGLDMEMPGRVAADSPFAALMPDYFAVTPPKEGPPPKLDPKMLAGLFGTSMPEEPPPEPELTGPFVPHTARANFYTLMHSGKLTAATVTRAAGRVLGQMDRFGLLAHPPSHLPGPHAVDANAAVIRRTAEDGAVLLKNADHILPLTPAKLRSLALIGPGAGQVVAIGTAGERSTGWPSRQVGPLKALRVEAPGSHIVYAVADDMTGAPIPAGNLSHDGKPGLLRLDASNREVRTDAILDFTKSSKAALPVGTRVSWQGTLTVPVAGDYWVYLQILGAGASAEIDGKSVAFANGGRGALHGDTVLAGKNGLLPTTDGLDNVRVAVTLSAGPHALKVKAWPDSSGAPEQVRLAWLTPQERKADRKAALAAAAAAKTVVFFAWSRGLPTFALPGDQDRLIGELAAINPNIVVVLNTSQPVAMPWLSRVKAVLEMWWPGDEGGWATADLLLGRKSPAGRLPVTWARRLADYAATDPGYPERRPRGPDGTVEYSEGIYVGYRWFDLKHIAPLYPFGYGLSYTHFTYSKLRVTDAPDGGLGISVRITNDGPVGSDEVPQVYLAAPERVPEGAHFAVHALAAFARVYIPSGQWRDVLMRVPARRLEYWSVQSNGWIRATGPRNVLVGRSSRDLPLSATVDVH